MTTQIATATDAPALPAGLTTFPLARRLSAESLTRTARGVVVRLRAFRLAQRREDDIDRIAGALARLNDRQLDALGLKRDTLFGHVAARVDAYYDRAEPGRDADERLALEAA